MAAPAHSAPAQFLREPELRRGLELLYFGHSYLNRSIDQDLATQGLGRAHHRALYFISRKPDLTVSELLSLLAITKQSLGRVLNELTDRGLVENRPGDRDRRQRLLRLSESGRKLESELFEAARQKISEAYSSAGPAAVAGFWAVLEGLIPEPGRPQVEALRR
ncbi:MarR family transcriptional regulator [Sphingomonas sp. Leaf339]|uniref:MarR family winged helix-turn-helix transcriptional regulator n=1 Tax=Sphingomonas sp. Leaf339 TaxID=1736343 RepID=UPI0007011429|nr:MarR family transcriptional regulator [Sphingomonas sp. Leaf339]KQU61938.1 MarR family transcriptional regulator [Sphingomonas sp. Leaf339]